MEKKNVDIFINLYLILLISLILVNNYNKCFFYAINNKINCYHLATITAVICINVFDLYADTLVHYCGCYLVVHFDLADSTGFLASLVPRNQNPLFSVNRNSLN